MRTVRISVLYFHVVLHIHMISPENTVRYTRLFLRFFMGKDLQTQKKHSKIEYFSVVFIFPLRLLTLPPFPARFFEVLHPCFVLGLFVVNLEIYMQRKGLRKYMNTKKSVPCTDRVYALLLVGRS